ncbi:radical SAM/SPASM domain-containing protein [Dickeya chrysanthemi]|uniref:radical SAM/SPASM domain-containing protein n=1 Tax=Dickeya chrysanthemi TaxID=556 RepID=UPI0003A1DB84|nr:radical SAM/SPASM domain-containing protein [Dickeya chrysanthemi]
MHYFQQIINNNEENLKLLLTPKGEKSDELTQKVLFKKHVEIVNLELSYLCNRKCDYCPVRNSSRNQHQNFINIDSFHKIINELASIRYENRISLNLYNEPLLDPSLYEKIAEIRKKLPWCLISFNSNGDKINKNVLQKLSNSGLNYINITLHPPANTVQSTGKIVSRLKKIMERIDHADGMKYACGEFVEKNRFLETRILGITIKIQWPNYSKEGTYRGGKVLLSTMSVCDRTAPCVKPFREFTIFSDGAVVPCCEVFHDRDNNDLVMGNVQEKTVFEIYSNAAMSIFRRHVFTFGPKKGVCRQCSVTDYSSETEQPERERIISNL